MGRRVDGIVLGIRARGAVSDVLFGDTGPEVARQTGLPVLLYPPVRWLGRIPASDGVSDLEERRQHGFG